MPRVRVRDGPNRGTIYPVGKEHITIGRETDCTIQVLDKGASRHHAEVFRVGEMAFVRDLGSRNGTYVNEERVQEELLREGDRVVIGSTALIFESDPAPGQQVREIFFTDNKEEDASSHTLELRLDDLVGLEEGEEDHDTSNLRAIYQLGRVLGAESNLEAAQEKALGFLADLVRAEQAYLFALDEVTRALVPKARYERDSSAQAQVSRTIIRRCIKETRSVLTMNAMSDARFKSTESIVMKRIRSVMCVPLMSRGEVSGVIYLTSGRTGEAFVEGDLEVATATATLLGLTFQGLEAARKQRETFFGAVRMLVALTEARDPATRGHSERVADYAHAVATQLGLAERARTAVQLAALIHDVGKAGIPEEVFSRKETRLLSRGEPGTQHVVLGSRIAQNIPGAEEVAPAVLYHHERYDGSGYPEGLAGDAIPLGARIVGAADMLDHIVRTGGPGKTPLPLPQAVEELHVYEGRQLDPEAVRACAAAFKAGLVEESKTWFDPTADDSIDLESKGRET